MFPTAHFAFLQSVVWKTGKPPAMRDLVISVCNQEKLPNRLISLCFNDLSCQSATKVVCRFLHIVSFLRHLFA